MSIEAAPRSRTIGAWDGSGNAPRPSEGRGRPGSYTNSRRSAARRAGDPAFVHDEERDLFRWTDDRFAFSREHADWELLRKRGRLKEWE
jgi:hypothetical protein